MRTIALVTGASGGIGRALACHLRDQGCRVAAVSRNASRLAEVVAVDGGFTTVRPLVT